MAQVRNILLIGGTNSGKSTLANVLSGTNNFAESNSGNSETKEVKSVEFEIEINNKKIKYKVIDTIGFGDTELKPQEVLERTKAVSREITNGLNQIFFITRGRFDERELEIFDILKNTIFAEEIDSYTTIIRTDFDNFEDEKECAEETEKLKEKNQWFLKMFKSCNGLVYINNPSINITGSRANKLIVFNKETREISRKKLLDHLTYNCSNYYPIGLESLIGRISNYMTEKERLEKELEDLRKANEEERKLSREERVKNSEKEQEFQAQIEVLRENKDF
jgi:GTP-binding protein EngB required for normal cell division